MLFSPDKGIPQKAFMEESFPVKAWHNLEPKFRFIFAFLDSGQPENFIKKFLKSMSGTVLFHRELSSSQSWWHSQHPLPQDNHPVSHQ